jgi:hypothetical protein
MISAEDEGAATDGREAAEKGVVEVECLLRWRGDVEDIAGDNQEIGPQLGQLEQQPIEEFFLFRESIMVDEARA